MASTQFVEWLVAQGAPEDVLVALAAAWSDDDALGDFVGSSDLWSAHDVMRRAADHEARCLGEGLLAIGNCANGDPIVVDLRADGWPIGYVSHEQHWGGEPARSVHVVVAANLLDFLDLAWDETFPRDFFAARDR